MIFTAFFFFHFCHPFSYYANFPSQQKKKRRKQKDNTKHNELKSKSSRLTPFFQWKCRIQQMKRINLIRIHQHSVRQSKQMRKVFSFFSFFSCLFYCSQYKRRFLVSMCQRFQSSFLSLFQSDKASNARKFIFFPIQYTISAPRNDN